jgi:hypothetical protein
MLVKQNIAQRQSASAWLNRMAEANIVVIQKVGRTNYFINQKLLDIFATPHIF